ncbi:aspartate/glutamate racemase family protein [Planococcus salinus]|uniref:Asp/Glu racemase n=1 Tax=Planococcus salinus TaxID=1848460 RepID=A0A3M8P9G4_9BACL|nr:aspartate/glutamate racemase family protein [Planococcus salinus]RNF40318.1 Asp/Glu racemase [Planococcus salinus]
MNQLPYGWRGQLGLIYIASAWSMEAEYADMAPPGVTTHTTRVALSDDPTNFSLNDVCTVGEDAVKAAKLLAQAPLDAIAFGCTSGSFTNGVGYDQQLIRQMEALANGIPCTTTITAVLKALQAFNMRKIAIATPYEEAINNRAVNFFEDSGFSVENMLGLGMANDYDISHQSIETVYRLAKQADTKDAEAVFIACTGLTTVRVLEVLEADLGKPVISANQATFWHSLQLAGIKADIRGFGSLFQL